MGLHLFFVLTWIVTRRDLRWYRARPVVADSVQLGLFPVERFALIYSFKCYNVRTRLVVGRD